MAGYFATDIVKEGTPFNRAAIEGTMKRQGVTSIDKGDVVPFHTGWTKLIGKGNKRYGSVEVTPSRITVAVQAIINPVAIK